MPVRGRMFGARVGPSSCAGAFPSSRGRQCGLPPKALHQPPRPRRPEKSEQFLGALTEARQVDPEDPRDGLRAPRRRRGVVVLGITRVSLNTGVLTGGPVVAGIVDALSADARPALEWRCGARPRALRWRLGCV